MRVLILGGDGMLGHKMFQVLSKRFDTSVTFRSHRGPWVSFPMYLSANPRQLLGGVDANDFHSIIRAVSLTRPDVIINCIGVIKQMVESADPILCLSVNSLFPHYLAQLCTSTCTRMIHISTDCVFSGRRGNYSEIDVPDAEDLYGRTKLLGEVNQSDCLTIRTSIIRTRFPEAERITRVVPPESWG